MLDLTEEFGEPKEIIPNPVPKAKDDDFDKYATALQVKHDMSEKRAYKFLHVWFKTQLLDEVENKTITPEEIARLHNKPIEEVYLYLYATSPRFYPQHHKICNHLNVSFKEFLKIDFL